MNNIKTLQLQEGDYVELYDCGTKFDEGVITEIDFDFCDLIVQNKKGNAIIVAEEDVTEAHFRRISENELLERVKANPSTDNLRALDLFKAHHKIPGPRYKKYLPDGSWV